MNIRFEPHRTSWRVGVAWGEWDYGTKWVIRLELGPLRWSIYWNPKEKEIGNQSIEQD